MTACLVLATLLLCSSAQTNDEAPRLIALSRLPVKEVTVFKDGHAYVIHQGKASVEGQREVRLDYLPTPILGTFWVYSGNDATPVRKVTASIRRVSVERTALTIPDLLAANVGADITLREKGGKPYRAKIVGFPTRTSTELQAVAPPYSDPQLPERSNVLLVSTDDGVLTVPIERVESVAFRRPPKSTVTQEEFRNVLTVSLPEAAPGSQAELGLMYVQKGIRWIPSYRVDIDGKGRAQVRMQATIINELVDLQDATVNLVIGVPSFAFEQTPDPMSLQQTFANLSPHFDKSSLGGQALGKAVMTQAARMAERGGVAADAAVSETPEVAGEGRSEDYFVFTVRNVTLKKGARMVMPVTEFTIPYRDVYTLTVPFVAPPEVQPSAGDPWRTPVALRVLHQLRLTNESQYPLTTAPALILSRGQVLAQGMLTYTAQKAASDLTLTTAVDIKVKRADTETGRIPASLTLESGREKVVYGRTDMAGKLTLTNYKAVPVDIEVTRYVVGHVDRADAGGEAVNVDPYADDSGAGNVDFYRVYPWPAWWTRVNGVGRFTWKVHLEPGQTTELGCYWHYFWQ